MIEREIGDVHLAHLRNENEPFTRHGQGIGQLDVTGENQDEIVARPELVIGRHGTGEQRQKLCRRPLEYVDAEHVARRSARPPHDTGVEAHQRGIRNRQTQCLNGGKLLRTRRGRTSGSGRVDVRIEQRRRITAGRQSRANLFGAEARLRDPAAHHIAETRLLLERLLDLRGRRLLGGEAWRQRRERHKQSNPHLRHSLPRASETQDG